MSNDQFPNFYFEKKYWDKGFVVIGVDEVGRGAIAGPVVAAAAGLLRYARNDIISLGIDDSKKLSRKKREELEPLIKKYFYLGIGESSVKEINKFGIVRATGLAMKRAFRDLNNNYKFFKNYKILIDGRRVKGIGHQEAIIKGDQKSISIAAASIVAKVYRDNLMRSLCGKYLGYGFENHVGYGTLRHAEAIKKLGISEIHRTVFVRSLLKTKIWRGGGRG